MSQSSIKKERKLLKATRQVWLAEQERLKKEQPQTLQVQVQEKIKTKAIFGQSLKT